MREKKKAERINKVQRYFDRAIPFIFLLITIIFFRTYFLTKKVPLPLNLLASFYSPWKYETWTGYKSGVPNKPLGYDNLKLFIPFKKFTIEEMKKRKIPLWNPYVFSGSVHHATYQSALFYPLNVVYFFLPLVDAWSVMVLSQPVLAGWFMYLFLRSLSLRRSSGFVGALGYAYSGWMISYWQEVLVVEHSILWLPLALFAVNRIWQSSQLHLRWFGLCIFAFSCSVLAGFPQMIVYVFLTSVIWNIFLWFFYKNDIHRTQKLVAFCLCLVVVLLLTAIQWIPALEVYLLSPRAKVYSSYIFSTFLAPLRYLVTFIAPDYWGNPGTYNYFAPFRYLQERSIYIGIVLLFFGLYGLFNRSKSVATFWKFFTVTTLSLGFALPTSWIWFALRVPILSVGQPERIFGLATFGLCILAAFGLDAYRTKESYRITKGVFQIIVIVLFLLWINVAVHFFFMKIQSHTITLCQKPPITRLVKYCSIVTSPQFVKQSISYSTISMRNLIIPTITVAILWFILWRFNKNPFNQICAVIAMSIISSFYMSEKLLYFSDRKFEYPLLEPIQKLKELAEFNRVWSYGDAYLVRNIPTYFGLYSPEGYEALYSYRYGALLHTITTGGLLSEQIQRTDATLSETGQNEIMSNNPYRLRLMKLLGVRYILEVKDVILPQLSINDRFPPSLFRIVWEDKKWRIWEYLESLPRAYIATQFIVEKDSQKIVDMLYSTQVDISKAVILEEVPKGMEISGIGLADSLNHAKILRYEPGVVDIQTETQNTALLFLSDTYFPGWRAYINEQEVKIYRADFSFRSVVIPKGIHTVRFVYDPLSFKIGAYMSLSAAAVLFCGGIGWTWYRRIYKRSSYA